MVQTALKGHLMLAGDDFLDRLMSDRGSLFSRERQPQPQGHVVAILRNLVKLGYFLLHNFRNSKTWA